MRHGRRQHGLPATLALTVLTLVVLVSGPGLRADDEPEPRLGEPVVVEGTGEASCTGMTYYVDGQQVPSGSFRPLNALRMVDLEVGLILPVMVKQTAEQAGGEGPAAATGASGLFKVRFVTPRGALYEEKDVPYADGKSGEKERKLAGYPFAVPVKAIENGGSGKAVVPVVKVKLAVGGTNIVQAGLYGTWTVVAERAGAKACKGTFRLAP